MIDNTQIHEPRAHQSRGSVVVISLFVLLVMSFLAGILTILILNTIRNTASYSLSQRSYYAAESGVEEGMYFLQVARVSKAVGVEETVDQINSLSATEADPTTDFTNDAEYTVEATADNDYVVTDVATNDSVTLDFFDEDYTSGYSVIPITDLSTIFVGWSEDSSCAIPGSSRIEISFSSWLPNYWQDIIDPSFQTRYVVTCPSGSGAFQCEYNGLGVDDVHIYSIRVKSLDCDLVGVTIGGFDSSSNLLTNHNEVTITATGTLSSSQQFAKTTSLWRTPLNDYFDYVLFSDEDLVK